MNHKKLFFKYLVLACSLYFVSCSSDDDCNITCTSDERLITTNGACRCEKISVEPCEGVTCPDNSTCENGTCVSTIKNETVTGLISGNTTWTANTIYTLAGKVVVSEGATLNIEAGTIIKGAEGTGSLASALIVARGGVLNAMGTAESPIVMTSVLDPIIPGQDAGNLDVFDNGLWGGLIVLGYAPISVDGNGETSQIEGIPPDETFGIYGGTDVADNSGTITYVSVRHGGASIGSDNEINGITLAGVGNGTTINNIEVAANLDDGVEFFGGSVDVTNVVVWGADDDAIDVDQAYTGTINNAVVICEGDLTDHALEIDGPEGDGNGAFSLINLTVKGANQELANYRDGAEGSLDNAYFFGFVANPADGGEGDFTFSGDKTTSNYEAGLLTFTNVEITPATGVNIADIFSDFNETDLGAVSEVAEDTNTVGANSADLAWSLAAKKGAINF